MIVDTCYNDTHKYWGLDKGFFYYLVLCADDAECKRPDKVRKLMDYVDKFKNRTYRHPGECTRQVEEQREYGVSPEGYQLFYKVTISKIVPPRLRVGRWDWRDDLTTEDIRSGGWHCPRVRGMWGQWLRYAKEHEQSVGSFIAGPSNLRGQ